MNVTIVGGGRVGGYLASMLIKDGHYIKIVEMRAEHLQALHKDLPKEYIVTGNYTDPLVLERADIRRADVVVAATPTDETNLVVSTLAKFEFGVKRVIARANIPKNTWMYTPEMGVDVWLSEAQIMAHALAEEMSTGDMITLLKLQKGQYSLVQEKVHPDSTAAGKALEDINFPSQSVPVAIIRGTELLLPRGSMIMEAHDEVLAVVHISQLKEFSSFMSAQ